MSKITEVLSKSKTTYCLLYTSYINEYNYDWGGEGKYAQTQGEGKSTIITNFIAPHYDNAGPLMVFGDSSGDWNMMTDWMESGDTELGVIFNRYRKPGSDPIWQEMCIRDR